MVFYNPHLFYLFINEVIMNKTTYYKPFDLNSLFDQAFSNYQTTQHRNNPPVDIEETDEAYHLLVDLPGVKKEAISVTYKNSQLIIEGKRESQNDDHEKWIHCERFSGTFQRIINLSQDIKDDEISANFTDGVLEIFAKKHHQAKQITIN